MFKVAFQMLKKVAEYLHLAELLLHISRSETLGLLILLLTRREPWMWLLTLTSGWLVWLAAQASSGTTRAATNDVMSAGSV